MFDLKERSYNLFDKMKISIASPEKIRSWSYGEVLKAETINYRSLRPERDGLFCERIFGTTKEWECYCGKYKSIRYRGVICNRCGVEVAHFRVRRERVGHIELAAPVVHVWFYKSVPSRIGLLLNFTMSQLKSIVYFEKYVVIEPGDTQLEYKQILEESAYQEARKEYGSGFVVETGALAIKNLLSRILLEKEEEELKTIMDEKLDKIDLRLLKRLEIVKNLRQSGNRPEWMVLDVITVIPPELRPMVQLDSGRFATSDLNDLYRRVINRNNRLKRLISLKAPDIIIRNEKRMLQESCDALFDNSKRKSVIKGAGNRPLKSLTDLLKGKQGRFRQNLLGKRVDYSGRSVIVVGADLKLYQCGFPKKMALELFRPFVMGELIKNEIVYNVKNAKKFIEQERPEVWSILEKIIKHHPLLLNRAPTLHRLGIQAFEPVLIEGKALQLHPLVCHGFNADFDGDQMAVHVPLSIESQLEAWFLMLAPNNLLNPANGEPIINPTKDIVLGIYCLTKTDEKFSVDTEKAVSSVDEAIMLFENNYLDIHSRVCFYQPDISKVIHTTIGRIIFNSILPEGMEYHNDVLDSSKLAALILEILEKFGNLLTVKFLDDVKDLGFKYATYFGVSIGIDDIKIPEMKYDAIEAAENKVYQIIKNYQDGYLTEDERYNQIIDIWTEVSNSITDIMMEELKVDQSGFNPLYVMAKSGARGSKQQIRQLAAMRGLMAKPSGEIIELPIKSNFKEGLTVSEYFLSTHGARKGLADTAIKTADAGYLTRRLVDIAQDVVIIEEDCGTINGTAKYILSEKEEEMISFVKDVEGKFLLNNLYHPSTEELIFESNTELTKQKIYFLQKIGVESVYIRTVIGCESRWGLCIKCYGRNLATGRIVEIGEAVGIIAAQSIGQPGTQLTMRTFHIGGTASGETASQEIRLSYSILLQSIPENIVKVDNALFVSRKDKLVYQRVYNFYDAKLFSSISAKEGVRILAGDIVGHMKNGEVITSDYICKSTIINDTLYLVGDIQTLLVKSGTKLFIKDKAYVAADEKIAEFDAYNEHVIAEKSGKVKFTDIVLGMTLKIESEDTGSGKKDKYLITDCKDGNLAPKVQVLDEEGNVVFSIGVPIGSYLLVREGHSIKCGDTIAKISREQTKIKDITGGLPRISELFEARSSKYTCVIAEHEGKVVFGPRQKGKRVIYIDSKLDNGKSKMHKYVLLSERRLLVYEGEYIKVGTQLCDGVISLHDLLRIEGIKSLCRFLTNEIRHVYNLQGVDINDKHISVIIRQMLRKVEVLDTGDTDFIVGQQVDRFAFQEKNESVVKDGGKAAIARPILQGITKSALNIDSFIASAAFQETTKVLTNAAIRGKVDYLRGLKENVIIGHLIPAGTGLQEKKLQFLKSKLHDSDEYELSEAISSSLAEDIDHDTD